MLEEFTSKEDEKHDHKNKINMWEWVKPSYYLEGSWARWKQQSLCCDPSLHLLTVHENEIVLAYEKGNGGWGLNIECGLESRVFVSAVLEWIGIHSWQS